MATAALNHLEGLLSGRTRGANGASGLESLHLLVGEDVSRSLAPQVLNAAYGHLELPILCAPVSSADFDSVWHLAAVEAPALVISVDAMTVVRPFKERALAVAADATPGARRASAANLLVRCDEGWKASNTSGVVDPLILAGIDPAGRSAAIVGCGGAGRSIAGELLRSGTEVTLVNRGTPRGEFASRTLGLPWIPLDEFRPDGFDLIVNATPLADELPFDVERVAPEAALVDLVYNERWETALIAAARARGLRAVDGRRVLAAELGRQLRLIAGQPMPAEAEAIAIGDHR